MKAKYDRSEIMRMAWKLYRAIGIMTMESFSESLKKSWDMAKKESAIKNDFALLYKSKQKSILSYVRFKLGVEKYKADDIVSETFKRTFERFESLNKTNIQAYLYTAAYNIYLNDKKVSSRSVNVSDYVNSEGVEVYQYVSDSVSDSGVTNSEVRNEIGKAFEKLNVNVRVACSMYFINGLKYREIADKLGVDINVIKQRIMKGRAVLQRELVNIY